MKYVKRGALDCFTVVVCEKRAAFGACFAVGYEKQAVFRGCHGVGGGKCGALDCFMVVEYEKRIAFSCPCVGAYCIRPTNVPPKEGESPAFGRVQAFAIHEMALCGAYSIRPYPDGRKMIAVGVCSAALPEKRTAFRGCYGVGGGKRGAFTCPCVGAYCIRPTGDPFMGRMIQMIDHQCAFLPPAGPFGGAYAIRPYRVTRKMIVFGVCHWVRYEKRGAASDSYCLAWRCSCSRRPVLFRSCGG